ncbi:hypothetical protein FisN_15Lh080 [Fistulifera solaris]|uniref:Uncharacterized protein n=1 Tax=Fistulifera solaris TaxID=1519565 RepID=A0A1Z5KB47_FISSO|nr:hypothetical protein FisN_15Lh080 [Fistulifera solaris]|eukprot:GAX23365.1 hypothetical protein FisN_15Lh080 [Fistulifera solaris]
MADGNLAIVSDKFSEESPNETKRTPFPLGWTRVKRRRSDKKDETCCEDPLCRKRQAPLTSATLKDESLLSSSTNVRSFQGTAVFCLHEMNPSWFQGYFFQGTTTWGILCEQQEIDDCLQCADGGYRVLKVTLHTYSGGADAPEKIVIRNVEWTGGDMMRLLQAEGQLSMEPKHMYTAEKAVPLTKSIFKNLLRKLSHESDPVKEQQVLDILPDVAIIMGEMKVMIPIHQVNDEENTSLSNS